MGSRSTQLLRQLERAGRFLEDTALAVIVSAMILLAAAQIFMRNVLDTGILWGDELLRLMVLWVAVLGAVAASRSDKHISIAVLKRALAPLPARVAEVIVYAFTAAVSGIICWHAARFVIDTHSYGDTLLGDLPAWIFQVIIPVGFGLISYRYTLFSVQRLILLIQGRTAE